MRLAHFPMDILVRPAHTASVDHPEVSLLTHIPLPVHASPDNAEGEPGDSNRYSLLSASWDCNNFSARETLPLSHALIPLARRSGIEAAASAYDRGLSVEVVR